MEDKIEGGPFNSMMGPEKEEKDGKQKHKPWKVSTIEILL